MLRIPLPPWSLVVATDQPGLLLNALLRRFDLSVALDFYVEEELKEVVKVLAKSDEVDLLLSPHACRLVARASCGLPRKAMQHLRSLKRHYRNADDRQLGKTDVKEYLKFMGISEMGLGPIEFRYLKALADRGTASQESLALAIGRDMIYVRRQIEPVLARLNLLAIAPGGRQLTPLGKTQVEELRKINPELTPEKDEDNDDD